MAGLEIRVWSTRTAMITGSIILSVGPAAHEMKSVCISHVACADAGFFTTGLGQLIDAYWLGLDRSGNGCPIRPHMYSNW